MEPLDPTMTTKRVAEEFFKPYIKDKGDSGLEAEDNVYVISQSDDNNEFGLLVQALTEHFDDTDRARVHILIDLFAIDHSYTKAALQEELRQVRVTNLWVKEGKALSPFAILHKVGNCMYSPDLSSQCIIYIFI